jgi:hypothetical protein
MTNSETLTYEANYQDYVIKVIYYNKILEILVDGWGESYNIEMTPNTRKLPEFKRFTNPIRARIATGIFLCQQIHGYCINVEVNSNRPVSWWQDREVR